jgi:hypothetical protein
MLRALHLVPIAAFFVLPLSAAACTGGAAETTSAPETVPSANQAEGSDGTGGGDGSTAGASTTPYVDGGSKKDAGDGDSGSKKDAGNGGGSSAGLLGFCEHYIECGGTTYSSAQACVTDAISFWGSCRRPQLDAFGTCMVGVSCASWNPSAYDPHDTPCGALWDEVAQTPCNR